MAKVKISGEVFAELITYLNAHNSPLGMKLILDASAPKPRAKKEEDPTRIHPDGNDYAYFCMAWDAWPKTVKGNWVPGQGFEQRIVLKGSKLMAERNFKVMLAENTAEELYAAAVAYLHEAPSVKEGYVQNVSTFYGPKKGTVLEWLDRGRELLRGPGNGEVKQ